MEIADQSDVCGELLLCEVFCTVHAAHVLYADAAPVIANDVTPHCRLGQETENCTIAVNDEVGGIVHCAVACCRLIKMMVGGFP